MRLAAALVVALVAAPSASLSQDRPQGWQLGANDAGDVIFAQGESQDVKASKACDRELGGCYWLIHLEVSCEKGSRYSLSLRTDNSFGALSYADCIGDAGNGWYGYVPVYSSDFESLIGKGRSLEISISLGPNERHVAILDMNGVSDSLDGLNELARRAGIDSRRLISLQSDPTLTSGGHRVVIRRHYEVEVERRRQIAEWNLRDQERAEAEERARPLPPATFQARPPPPGTFLANPAGAINPFTGEYHAPAGSGYVGTRDGTFYAPAGPNGVINTRTGEFIPTH